MRSGAAKLYYKDKGFLACRLNQWSWALDTGTLASWRVLTERVFRAETRAQLGWAVKFQCGASPRASPWGHFDTDVGWPVFLANVAAGQTAVCSGTLHVDVGILCPEHLEAQHLVPKMDKLLVRYPYGRSVSACRLESIAPVLHGENWPS